MAGEEERFRRIFTMRRTRRAVFEFLAFCQDNPSSITQCIAKARENARTIRDYISREMWEDLNGLYFMVNRFNPAEEDGSGSAPILRCDPVWEPSLSRCDRCDIAARRGLGVPENRLVHRARGNDARLVDVQYQNLYDAPAEIGEQDNHQWMAVLRSVGAYEAYHKKYHSSIEPEKVAEMLIMHPLHPRSIRFSMTEVQSGLRAISGTGLGSYANEAERLTGQGFSRGCVRQDRGNLQTWPALVPERDVENVRLDLASTMPGTTSITRWWHESIPFAARNGISLRRTGFESYNEVRLRPMHDEAQSCLSFRLITKTRIPWHVLSRCVWNWVHQFNILPEHQSLKIEAESVVLAHDAPAPSADGMRLSELDSHREELEEEYLDFIAQSGYVPHVAKLDELIATASQSCDGFVPGFVQAASDLIHLRFEYVKGATHVNSSIEDSLAVGAGVCQDFAHLLLA